MTDLNVEGMGMRIHPHVLFSVDIWEKYTGSLFFLELFKVNFVFVYRLTVGQQLIPTNTIGRR